MAGEHAGEADQRQDGHHDLCGLAERHLGREEVRHGRRRVADLDADEDRAGGRGAEASDRGAAVGGGGGLTSDSFGLGAGRVSGDVDNLGIDVVSAHHTMM